MQKHPEKEPTLALDSRTDFRCFILVMDERVSAQTAPLPDAFAFGQYNIASPNPTLSLYTCSASERYYRYII